MRTAAPAGTSAADPASTPSAEARIAAVERVDLLNGAGVKAFALHGDVKKVNLTTAAPGTVAGEPTFEAVRATIKEESTHEYAVQLTAPTTAPIEAGDSLLATFYLRTETPPEGGVGETEFVLELAEPPYSKSI